MLSAEIAKLHTIIDLIRYGASCFGAQGLTHGHSHDNALDEATQLVLHALHLPTDLSPAYGQARLLDAEKQSILALYEQRILERIPSAYLIGEAWFAQLCFKSDRRALVPRSPIAELIERSFSPWLVARQTHRVLDMCTGSGCIAIATAHYHPTWHVDGVDISGPALTLAEENKQRLHTTNVMFWRSNLFSCIPKQPYSLIVANPPYVTQQQMENLPAEYSHEPTLGLVAGKDGLDITLKILRDAPDYLDQDGVLICEVGESAAALSALLPELPLEWVTFQVGDMGVFVVDAHSLHVHRAHITALANARP